MENKVSYNIRFYPSFHKEATEHARKRLEMTFTRYVTELIQNDLDKRKKK